MANAILDTEAFPETLGIPGNVYRQDPINNRWKASSLHDGVVSIIKPNYAGLGSMARYDWNKPRTGSQPPANYPLHMPRWNNLVATSNWAGRNIPSGQLGAYLVPVKTYGRSMEFAPGGVASLKG